MEKDTLFILKSPFQAMCACEAINAFKIENRYDVVLLKDTVNKEMTSTLLRSKGILFFEVSESLESKEVLKVFSSFKRKYRTCFVGNYYSLNMYRLALYSVVKGGVIKYMDDGTATLSLFLPNAFPRYYSKKGFLQRNKLRWDYLKLDIERKVLGVKQSLYTIYDVESPKWVIEKNKLETLQNRINCEKSGIYIIGTRSSYHFERADYIQLLENTVHYAVALCPGQPVYYCPHRADSYKYDDFLQKNDIRVFNTKVSVEIDFISNSINPMMVVGYGSTALLTLKLMFPSSIVTSIEIKSKAQSIYKGYKELSDCINDYYRSGGINIIDNKEICL